MPHSNIIVIGAGAAGIGATLELASRGHKVTLFEKNTIFSGASGRNPGRMGHGFHYLDVETALMYLRGSIKVQRKYPRYLVAQDKALDHPLRHGRYFITTDSDVPADLILATYKAIKDEYTRLVHEDSANEVFGSPNNFFRILERHEYAEQVDASIVAVGVETAEHLFNWQAFVKDIKQEILDNANITLVENAEVVRIERGEQQGEQNTCRFKLHVKTKSNKSSSEELLVIHHTNYVINSTWEQIESLNDQVGIRMIPESRTNRLKCLLTVKLPESLINANSAFFCMGQHCMFSNLGNGFGMMTFGNVTNMETSSALNLSKNSTRLLNGGATKEEKVMIAREMLQGVVRYIPKMKDATIVDVQFGIVQTNGNLTLEGLRDPHHAVHKRNYYGVREEQQGLISNPAVKLFYFVNNAELVADLIGTQIKTTVSINRCASDIFRLAKKHQVPLIPDVKKMLMTNLDRYTSPTTAVTVLNSVGFFQTIQHKQHVTQNIEAFPSFDHNSTRSTLSDTDTDATTEYKKIPSSASAFSVRYDTPIRLPNIEVECYLFDQEQEQEQDKDKEMYDDADNDPVCCKLM